MFNQVLIEREPWQRVLCAGAQGSVSYGLVKCQPQPLPHPSPFKSSGLWHLNSFFFFSPFRQMLSRVWNRMSVI